MDVGGDAPGAPASPSTPLNPYSCLACRSKRKKCDRIHPCASCRRKGIECVFAPRQPSTRRKTTSNAMERLRQLEAVIQTLREELEVKSSLLAAEDVNISAEGMAHGTMIDSKVADTGNSGLSCNGEMGQLQTDLGRLTVRDGKSRYTTGNFWANIHEEVDDLRSLMDDSSSDDTLQGDNPALLGIKVTNPTLIFGLSPSANGLFELHPSPDMIPVYWRIYKENCDFLVKVLHVPTVEPLVLQSATELKRISTGVQTLMFSIYFSAVVSLSREECVEVLGSDKDHLIDAYKTAMEQALAQARLLETDEFIVLQAFVIFLTTLRNHCNLRLMWTLTALAVRLGQNAGIHRDGTRFGLSPFTVEMRRRLWWNICVIDARASEDSGYDTPIWHEGIDTQLPLNINDSDLFTEMTEFPEPRTGSTDMMFSIVRFEAAIAFQAIHQASIGFKGICGKLHASKSLEFKSELISNYQDRIQEVFLGQHDMSCPFYWYTAIVSRISLSRMWLASYHPYLRLETCGSLPQDTRDDLFMRSVSIVESQVLLYTGAPTLRWSWLCVTHVHWYAITFILTELCTRTHGETVERAWEAINAVLRFGSAATPTSGQTATSAEFGHHSRLGELEGIGYKPLNKLLKKALATRDRAFFLSKSDIPMSYGEASQSSMVQNLDAELNSGLEGLDLLNMGLGGFTPDNEAIVSNQYPSDQLLQACEEPPYDHIIHNPLRPQVNDTAPN